MSDKDKNTYYSFQNQMPFYGFLQQDQMVCLMCFKPLIQTNFQTYQIICNECLHNFYCAVTSENPQLLSQSITPVPQKPIQRPKQSFIKVHQALIFEYSQIYLHSMIFICDFCSQFSNLLKISPFTLSTLYETLQKSENKSILTDICQELISKIIDNAFRSDSEFIPSEKAKILNLGLKIKELNDIRKIMILAWPSLIGEILSEKYYKDYVKGTRVEKIKKNFRENLTKSDILSFGIEEKIGLIEFLINCFLDTKECREFISIDIEKQSNLTKIRHEKKLRIRSIEAEMMGNTEQNQELVKERDKLYAEEQEISQELSKVHYRTISLGSDAFNNEYYFFSFEKDKIFVQVCTENNESTNWQYYTGKESLEKLISELCHQNKKALKLRENIEKCLRKEYVESQKTEENKEKNYEEFEIEEFSIEEIKISMKNLEKNFSKHLKNSRKRWDYEANEKKWKKSLNSADDIEDVSELLFEFSEKATNPLRLLSNSKKNRGKFRKVQLKIWQNCSEAAVFWEKIVKSIKSIEELTLALEVYKFVIEAYVNKRKDESFKHSDECFKCNDGGKLIMCEHCPRVAHLKCVGLKKIPEGEWQCENCL